MKYAEGKVLEALHAVQMFLDKHGEVLAEVNTSGARAHIDEVAAELEAMARQQEGGLMKARGETARQRELRELLRRHMRPIAAVAEARLREVPQFTSLRMPDRRLQGTAIVVAARGMAEAALPYVEEFRQSGLHEQFIERLRQAADALSASLDKRRVSQTARTGATQGLADAERRGRQALKIMDALVTLAIGDNEVLMRGWDMSRRVQLKPGRPRQVRRKADGAVEAASEEREVSMVPIAADAEPSPTHTVPGQGAGERGANAVRGTEG